MKDHHASSIAGLVSGSLSVIVGYPIDTVLAFAQTGKHIAQKDLFQISRLYRGFLVPFTTVCIQSSLAWYAYTWMKGQVSNRVESVAAQGAICGSFSGLALTFFVSPRDLLTLHMQLGKNETRNYFAEYLHTGKRLYATGGVRGICRGLPATMVRDGFGNAMGFAVYEYTKKELLDKGYKTSVASPIAGSLSGIAFWSTYPISTFRTRIQQTPPTTSISSIWSGVRKQGVVSALWRGYGLCIARAIILSAFSFSVYEATLKLVRGSSSNNRARQQSKR